MSWTPEQLARFGATRELEIAVRRADGTLRTWTPIWVVDVVGDVYVRTWYRRDTGWFGLALSTGHARVRVPGVEVDVRIEDVGVGPPGLREIGLLESIEDITDDMKVAKGIHVQLDIHNIVEAEVDEQRKLTLFRIVQEQLNNIMKHAKATEVLSRAAVWSRVTRMATAYMHQPESTQKTSSVTL